MDVVLGAFLFFVVLAVVYVVLAVKQVPQGREWTVERFGKYTRTLAPGEAVAFPIVWGGLTSEPTCTAARTSPPAGNYVLRGRLDTKVSADAPVVLA